jgi:hypothetical protein
VARRREQQNDGFFGERCAGGRDAKLDVHAEALRAWGEEPVQQGEV